jgi:hypothetical protein
MILAVARICGAIMKTLTACVLLALLTACAHCKSSDSYEVCRTKQRDHGQTRP